MNLNPLSLKKQTITHNLALFVATDNLIALATALNAGDELLMENNCFELKARLLNHDYSSKTVPTSDVSAKNN